MNHGVDGWEGRASWITQRVRVRSGPIRPAPAVCATTDTAQSEERLLNSQNQAILTSDGRPLGVCRLTSDDWPLGEYRLK